MNKGNVFWGVAALIELRQMWKNRIWEIYLKEGER